MLGMSAIRRATDTCIVIAEVEVDSEGIQVGALADSVQEVIEIDPTDTSPPPNFGAKLDTTFIKGMGKRDDRFIIILDIDRVLASSEAEAMLSLCRESRTDGSEETPGEDGFGATPTGDAIEEPSSEESGAEAEGAAPSQDGMRAAWLPGRRGLSPGSLRPGGSTDRRRSPRARSSRLECTHRDLGHDLLLALPANGRVPPALEGPQRAPAQQRHAVARIGTGKHTFYRSEYRSQAPPNASTGAACVRWTHSPCEQSSRASLNPSATVKPIDAPWEAAGPQADDRVC